MFFINRYWGRRPVARVTTTTTRATTTSSNGVVTRVQTNSFSTALRRRYGYTSVTTSTTFSTTTTRGNVFQAPPTVNNPEPARIIPSSGGLGSRTRNFAQAYTQPAVPRTTTTTSVTTSVTTTVVRPIRPRWRLVPVGWGRWVWRRF